MKLLRKGKIEKNRKNGKISYIYYAIFLCSYCLQEVERQISSGKNQKSCGCVHNKKENHSQYKHGESKTRLYGIWNGMIQRCLNFKASNYKDYGGRDITICNEWLDFIPFRDWSLNNGYKENLQINRINNNGNYEPSNCNFVTAKENARKTRRNKLNLFLANEIRDFWFIGNITKKFLAEKYNVSKRTISLIINNKIWK